MLNKALQVNGLLLPVGQLPCIISMSLIWDQRFSNSLT